MIAALLLAVTSLVPTVHHPVNTSSAAAQATFDRGLLLYYAYNGEAAHALFAQALALDPHLAMAAWGEALADGPDLNTSISPERFAAAQADIQRAVALEHYASPDERAYIDATSLRYAGSAAQYAQDDERYIDALAAIVAHAPADDDANMLYAEALMERDITDPTARAAIAATLARSPQHVLANHLCVHTYDFADDHRPALPCARRVLAWTFSPDEVHLAHMPVHTFIVLGRYERALEAAERAWHLREEGAPDKYEAHDAYVGFSAAMMLGDLQSALLWAQRTGAAYGGSDAWATYARFGLWDRLNGTPQPREFFAVLASGLAAVHDGDLRKAQALLKRYGNEDADYRWILEGAVDDAQGRIDDAAAAFAKAIAYQSREHRGEELPLFPAGEFLGAMYLHHARYEDAIAAYTQTLARFPNDPRALYGLASAQRHLRLNADAVQTLRTFSAVWGRNPAPALGAGLTVGSSQ